MERKNDFVAATLMFCIAAALTLLALVVADEAPIIAGGAAFAAGWIAASSVKRAWRAQ